MQQRSTFVEIIAWVFIVLSGFAVLIGILQNIMVFMLFPEDVWVEMASEARQHEMPGSALLAYFRYFFLFSLLLMIGILVTSVNLLRRREWARKMFVVFMLIGVVWAIGGLGWQLLFLENFAEAAPQDPGAAGMVDTMRNIFSFAFIAMAAAFAGLYGWIAWKLTRPQIRAEFA